jgi:hypothetical protein
LRKSETLTPAQQQQIVKLTRENRMLKVRLSAIRRWTGNKDGWRL